MYLGAKRLEIPNRAIIAEYLSSNRGWLDIQVCAMVVLHNKHHAIFRRQELYIVQVDLSYKEALSTYY